METILRPDRKSWEALCRRPAIDRSDLETTVRDILGKVRRRRSTALVFSLMFDGYVPADLKVTDEEIKGSAARYRLHLKRQ